MYTFEFFWFFYLLLLAVLIVIEWFSAKQFYAIAKMKGHSDKKYFWWCFWTGILGWSMVIALPNRGGIQTENTMGFDDLPYL